MFRKALDYVLGSWWFALASTMALTAPPGARRLRRYSLPKFLAGGLLGRIYHSLRIPFEFTPLLSLPFIAAGAWFLYYGPTWL